MTQKTQAIAAMGQRCLLLPGWINAALSANDRLKLYLGLVQAAFAHAEHPAGELPDLTAELVASHVDTPWLRDMPASASLVDGTLLLPDLARLVQRFAEDLETMARPLLRPDAQPDALRVRVHH
ncbi:hypothetical protein [Paraburkholderia sp. RL17-373-BIF-A]|uniref:hypothetical protein n=1 Tax=Paraburkholderia sp. RL17-373-BIF-A TaxID=3031629 RepID=UPI0038BB719C